MTPLSSVYVNKQIFIDHWFEFESSEVENNPKNQFQVIRKLI